MTFLKGTMKDSLISLPTITIRLHTTVLDDVEPV